MKSEAVEGAEVEIFQVCSHPATVLSVWIEGEPQPFLDRGDGSIELLTGIDGRDRRKR